MPPPDAASPAAVELYVYYRAPGALGEPLRAAVEAAQRALAARHPELQARLLQRADAASAEATWMEIYRHPAGIGAALEAEIEVALQAALSGFATGARHVEHFVPCAS